MCICVYAYKELEAYETSSLNGNAPLSVAIELFLDQSAHLAFLSIT